MKYNHKFLVAFFIFLVSNVVAQKETYVVLLTTGNVFALTKEQKVRINGKFQLDNFQFLKIKKSSSVVLVNKMGIPVKLNIEGVFPVQSLGSYFKSDPMTSKYFKYIWDEIELKKNEKESPKLSAVGSSIRGKDAENPQMLCPYDSTIAVFDTICFSWSDPMNKNAFCIFIIDYQNDQKIVFRKQVYSTSFCLDLKLLALQPGKDYGWIVSYSDSLTKNCFLNILTLPAEEWVRTYQTNLANRYRYKMDEYEQLGLAFFLLENRQYCEAKAAYLQAVSINENDMMIKKSGYFFAY